MIVKLSPYMSPFAPPAEPGVYWLGLEHQGYALHDGHVVAWIERRRAKLAAALNPISCAPGQRQAHHILCPPSQSAESVLRSCGVDHMAAPRRSQAFSDDPDFLHALASDGVRAAGRRVGREPARPRRQQERRS